MAPNLVGCQALPCPDAASLWWTGPGHEVADCRAKGDPRASAGSLFGSLFLSWVVVGPEVPDLVLTFW